MDEGRPSWVRHAVCPIPRLPVLEASHMDGRKPTGSLARLKVITVLRIVHCALGAQDHGDWSGNCKFQSRA